jgi:hypothetical protein
MAPRRDSKGRFSSGSGAIGSSRRNTSSGADARRSARTLKSEQSGNKARAQGDARYGRTTTVSSVASSKTRSANQAKQRGKTMERERRSLVRRGAMRGGG